MKTILLCCICCAVFTAPMCLGTPVSDSATTPEPATIVLMGAGLVGIGLFARRRKQ